MQSYIELLLRLDRAGHYVGLRWPELTALDTVSLCHPHMLRFDALSARLHILRTRVPILRRGLCELSLLWYGAS